MNATIFQTNLTSRSQVEELTSRTLIQKPKPSGRAHMKDPDPEGKGAKLLKTWGSDIQVIIRQDSSSNPFALQT
jgi:hypothetical protein